jgi:hypothetical protein
LDQEKTDQELAEESTETAKEIAAVSPAEWKRVIQCKARGELLFVAQKYGSDGVRRFLRHLTIVWRN